MIYLKQNTANDVVLVVDNNGNTSYLMRVYNSTTDKTLTIEDISDYTERSNKFSVTLSDSEDEDLSNALTDLSVGIYTYEIYQYSATLELSTIITKGLMTVGEETDQEILTETKEQFINSIYE